MATLLGVTTSTVSSGTVPPLDWHSPQKNDTRKNAQQAPQDVQGEVDMVNGSIGGWRAWRAIYHHCLLAPILM
jgi:hypothetical protein